MKTKYFNNAGASLMSDKTLNVMVNHFKREMEVGGYKAAVEQSDKVKRFYQNSAIMVNAADFSEIAYVDSASRGWNMVLYGLSLNEKDTIVTLESEYGTNLLTIYDVAQRTGCKVNVVPCDDNGNIDELQLKNALNSDCTVLAISHVAAQGSIVNPVEKIGEWIADKNIIYIVDGCQALGQIPVNVQKIHCHAYISAGRKWLRGPRGTGLIYVKKESPIRTPQIDLASAWLVFDDAHNVKGLEVKKDAKQFELWERNIAALLGLDNAICEYLQYGQLKAHNQIVEKANTIRKAIADNANLQIVGNVLSDTGVAAFYLKDNTKENEVKQVFEDRGFIISIICDWDCPIFFPTDGTKYIYRISPHYYTSDEDVKELCELISNL